MQPVNTITALWREGVPTSVANLTAQAFTEESGAHRFVVEAATESGAGFSGTVSALFLRADGQTIAIDGEISDGKAAVTLVGDCYHVPGRYSIAIYVSDGTDSTCVYAAVGTVIRTSSDTVLDSGAEIPTLAQLEAAYAACVSAAGDAEAAAASSVRYDAAQTPTAAEQAQARQNLGIHKIMPRNLAEGISWTQDRSIRSDTGTTRSSSVYKASGFIDIQGCSRITYQQLMSMDAAPSGYVGIAFYSSNSRSSFISGVDYGYSAPRPTWRMDTVDVPEGAKYMSATWRKNTWLSVPSGFYVFDADEYEQTLAEIVLGTSERFFLLERSLCSADTMTAASAHAAGTLVIVGGVLYYVTSAIAVGDTISDHAQVYTLESYLGSLASQITALTARVEALENA